MSAHEFVWTLIVGIVIGWGAHGIVLQLAYRFGIVEYRGRWDPVKQTTDPNCPHCRGTGYDASGYACTCVKEVK